MTLEPLHFLLGEWTGEGGGQPGQANEGSSTFSADLDGKIVVRRNRAAYPATKDRPAFVHEDLMVIFEEGGALRAVYWDSEGHVIRYEVRCPMGERAAVFESDPAEPGPRYRLTHASPRPDVLDTTFEVAPPGGAFQVYVRGTVRRRTP